jgi:aspartate/methionine/tyrosine aminotransferase
MTGWRLGWLVSRADLCAQSAIFNEFTVIHAASFTQRAGEAALEWGESAVAEMLEHYKANRDYVIQRLSSMPGVTVPRPEGAFYVFPKIEGLRNSFEFCRDLLMEKRVGAAPGVAFGAGGEGSIRICYAADRSVLEPAMDRIEDYLRSTSGIDRFVRGC